MKDKTRIKVVSLSKERKKRIWLHRKVAVISKLLRVRYSLPFSDDEIIQYITRNSVKVIPAIMRFIRTSGFTIILIGLFQPNGLPIIQVGSCILTLGIIGGLVLAGCELSSKWLERTQ